MTFEEKLTNCLFQNGISKEDAINIMEDYLKSDLGRPIKSIANNNVGDHPGAIFNIAWAGLKMITLDWMDKNCPKHWARPLFVDKELVEDSPTRSPLV